MTGCQSESSGTSANPLVKPYPFFARSPVEPSPLSPSDVVKHLRRSLGQAPSSPRAEIVPRDDQEFASSTTIFNGAVRSQALAVVKPLNAEHVSIVIKFCRKYNLELSVKAGGTGVHGWSVAGHIVLDLSSLNQTSVAIPTEAVTLQDSFARLQVRRSSKTSHSNGMADGYPQRPSLAAASCDSSESSTGKRNASEALDGDEEGRENKKRMDPIIEDRLYSSGSSNGEHDMSGSSSSGARSDSDSRDDHTTSTPGTSFRGSNGSFNPSTAIDKEGFGAGPAPSSAVSTQASPSSSSSSAPADAPRLQPRMTYVNPSPITTTSFPLVSTSFGAGPSSSSSLYPGSYPGSSPQLLLNTNPDPPDHTIVTFGAGVCSKQLDSFTAASPYGAYYVPTSAFPVGSGQFLLGGFGFIGRKHGLAMDNLVEAEMVLADGRIVWVGERGAHGGEWKVEENPEEVWWGLRGAGPSLGVVTRFRAKAYYLPSVFAGHSIYIFDQQTTPSLLRHVRDCVKGSPRSLYTNIILTAGPPGAPAIVVIQLCFSGPRAEGDVYLQAINSWDGGRCMFQDFSERTFERQQGAVEEVLKGSCGRKWYIKSDMLKSLTDEVIDESCSRFQAVPNGCTWLFEYTGGGCIPEIQDTAFPVSHRESSFTVAALHQWSHDEPPVQDTRCVTSAEDWIKEVIHPHSPGGPLPCFLQSATLASVKAVFGGNFDRLERLKAQMDPGNLFRHTAWPRSDAPLGTRQLGEDHPGNAQIKGDWERPADNDSAVDMSPKGNPRSRDQGQDSIFETLTCANKSVSGMKPKRGIDEGMIIGAPEAAMDMPKKQQAGLLVGRVGEGEGTGGEGKT